MIVTTATKFVRYLEQKDRDLRRGGSPIPSEKDKAEVADHFWALVTEVEDLAGSLPATEVAAVKAEFREVLAPWLLRSRYFWRSSIKPQGYAGDYLMIEWMYDLEDGAGDDPRQAAIVNCLDHAFSTIDSVVALWERRRWLRDLVADEIGRRSHTDVLDVACGGARYLRDGMRHAASAGQVHLTLVDQDPSALRYAHEVTLGDVPATIDIVGTPVKRIFESLEGRRFDVIVSSGLFDYLPQEYATALAGGLADLLNEGGCLAITNFHRDDRSGFLKDWVADWPLELRDDREVADLFAGSGLTPGLSRSGNGSLVMAVGRSAVGQARSA